MEVDVTSGSPSFSFVAHETDALRVCLAALRRHSPTVRLSDTHIPTGPLGETLAPLVGQCVWIVCTLLEAILAERASEAMSMSGVPESTLRSFPVARRTQVATELVWSGPTSSRSCARTTRETIEDLFSNTTHEVFVAGYSFDSASDLFHPLAARVNFLLSEGRQPPTVRVVLDCSRKKATSPQEPPEAIARRVCSDFLQTCWRDMPLSPDVRYLRASAERTSDNFARTSMHAKCIIVDRQIALVGSANFSNRGRDRNIEVGAIIRDHHFVQSLCAEWEALWSGLSLVV